MNTRINRIYKVLFHNQGKVYELFARHIDQGDLYGFIEVEGLIFGETSDLLIDPAQERLESEFTGVQRSFIPVHSIIRIDEVEREGISKVRESDGNIALFPSGFPPFGKK